MSKSIMQDNRDYCYIHMKYLNIYVRASEEHHCTPGSARRKLAEEDGLKIYLCHNCHQQLHNHNYHYEDVLKDAEQVWLDYYGKTKDEWIQRYIKNYL